MVNLSLNQEQLEILATVFVLYIVWSIVISIIKIRKIIEIKESTKNFSKQIKEHGLGYNQFPTEKKGQKELKKAYQIFRLNCSEKHHFEKDEDKPARSFEPKEYFNVQLLINKREVKKLNSLQIQMGALFLLISLWGSHLEIYDPLSLAGALNVITLYVISIILITVSINYLYDKYIDEISMYLFEICELLESFTSYRHENYILNCIYNKANELKDNLQNKNDQENLINAQKMLYEKFIKALGVRAITTINESKGIIEKGVESFSVEQEKTVDILNEIKSLLVNINDKDLTQLSTKIDVPDNIKINEEQFSELIKIICNSNENKTSQVTVGEKKNPPAQEGEPEPPLS